MTSFAELKLIEPIERALAAENYSTPTPIQAQAIPQLLAGRDLLGCAQTGTGKTAAFALPLLHRLAAERGGHAARSVRALILAPPRELAAPIGDSVRSDGRHLGLAHAVVYGGVNQTPQVRALARGVDILGATPGRLLDHIDQRHLRLDQVRYLVLDEADRMLDMGFIHDVRRILALVPKQRQTALFSATLPTEIRRLASIVLNDPAQVSVTPVASTVDRIEQSVMFVQRADKPAVLADVLGSRAVTRAIVFTRTKRGADKVARHLERSRIDAAAIHGNKSQPQRQKALDAFRAGRLRVLVATDIAARGIDVDGISHVINFDLPDVPESYVHRIGRTARAGAAGIAISFCDAEERKLLRDIEKTIRRPVAVAHANVPAPAAAPATAPAAVRSAPHDEQRRDEPGRGSRRGNKRPRNNRRRNDRRYVESSRRAA